MIDLFRNNVMTHEARCRYQSHLLEGVMTCLGRGHYLIGREADFIIPSPPALVKLARAKGAPDILNWFEGMVPFSDHLKDKSWHCWSDVTKAFQDMHNHRVPNGPVVNMTHGVTVEIARTPNGDLVGWAERHPRNLATGEPAKVTIRRGNVPLGVLSEHLTGAPRSDGILGRQFTGTLREFRSKEIIHDENDGLVEVVVVYGIAHLAALEMGELDARSRILKINAHGQRTKEIAVNAIKEVVFDYASLVPEGQPKTFAAVSRMLGEDWRQTSLQCVDAAFKKQWSS